MHFLLMYDVIDDFQNKRTPFRGAHLELAQRAVERGELVLGGSLANPVDGSILLFRGDSPEVAERFAKADPYVTSGVVTRWRVRQWTTVIGALAEQPIAIASGQR